MKLYPYARANEHGHAVALFSSSPSKRTAAYRKPCAVDRAEDLDALLAAAWGVLGVELPIDGAALSRLCLDAYTAVGGDDQPIRPGIRTKTDRRACGRRGYRPTAASFTSSEWTSRAASGTNPASLS